MGKACLLDTNAIIYFLKGRLVVKDMEMVEAIIHDSLNISVVTKIELLCWKTISTEETKTIRNLINFSNIFYLDEPIAERAIVVRKNYGLKLPDAIVAATVLSGDFRLITGDKEFARLQELDSLQIEHL